MNLTEVAFLILLYLGIGALLGGLLWARLNWRLDVPPYGRHTRAMHVMLHPERYVKKDSLRGIRTMNLSGGLLLASAAAIVGYDLFSIASGR